MLNNRRTEVEIIRDIIILSQNGVRKTEILYQVNLSFHQLKNYLSYLLEKEILEERTIENNGSNGFSTYHTTPKGNELLTNINKTLSYFT